MSAKVDLNGKVAVVTGGGGILCSTMAKALAECGAKVAILDLRPENAEKVAAEINQNGGTAIGIATNVLELDSLKAAEKQIRETFGTCDILVNGAGGNHPERPPRKNSHWKTSPIPRPEKFHSSILIRQGSVSSSI